MKYIEWQEKLEDKTPEYREELKNHLIGLRNIVMFADEFQWTGIFDLIYIIDSIDEGEEKE